MTTLFGVRSVEVLELCSSVLVLLSHDALVSSPLCGVIDDNNPIVKGVVELLDLKSSCRSAAA